MRRSTVTENAAIAAIRARVMDADMMRTIRATDAAQGTSFGFLIGQLELIDPDVVKPLSAIYHPRDIPVEFGGGFPEVLSAWAVDYGSSGGGFFGLQGTENTELAEAQANIRKGIWPVFNWAGSFTIPFFDLKRMETMSKLGTPPPMTLQRMYDASIDTVWMKALDYNGYAGFNGWPGLINNPSVPSFVVAPTGTGSSTLWSQKTPTQMLADLNTAINVTYYNAQGDLNGVANTCLLPATQFQQLSQPITIGSVGYQSTIDYMEKNCVARMYGLPFKINVLPNQWISGMGIGGLDRGVVYRKDTDTLVMRVPQQKMLAYTIPTNKMGYTSYFAGAIGAIEFKRTQPFAYFDGV